MNTGILFHDDSAGNWVAVVFFIILFLFIPLAALFLSPKIRLKMQYVPGKKDYMIHAVLFFVIGIAGVLCLEWKKNKIDTITLKQDNSLVLTGIFGNTISEFRSSEITDVGTTVRNSKRSSNTFIIKICVKEKNFYTNDLSKDEAGELLTKLGRLTGKYYN